MTRFDWMARGNLGANIGLHWKSAKMVHKHWPMTGNWAGRAASWALNSPCPCHAVWAVQEHRLQSKSTGRTTGWRRSMILSSSENSKVVSMAATIVARRDLVPPLPSRNEQVEQHQPPTYQRMLPQRCIVSEKSAYIVYPKSKQVVSLCQMLLEYGE